MIRKLNLAKPLGANCGVRLSLDSIFFNFFFSLNYGYLWLPSVWTPRRFRKKKVKLNIRATFESAKVICFAFSFWCSECLLFDFNQGNS